MLQISWPGGQTPWHLLVCNFLAFLFALRICVPWWKLPIVAHLTPQSLHFHPFLQHLLPFWFYLCC